MPSTPFKRAAAAALAMSLLTGCVQTPDLDRSAQAGLSLRLRDGLEALPVPPRRLRQEEAWAAVAPAFSSVLRRQTRADGGGWDTLRRVVFEGAPRRERPVFQSGEALPRTPLLLANGLDKSGRLHSLPLRAADDPPGRASADWAFILGENARLHLLRVPAGVLPDTGGRFGGASDTVPRPEQHVVLLTDGGVCARDWRDGLSIFKASPEQPRGVLLHRDRCNGLFWWPVRTEGMAEGVLGGLTGIPNTRAYWYLAAGRLEAPPDGFLVAGARGRAWGNDKLAQPNEQLRYAEFVQVVGRDSLELGVAQRDFAPAGWHFPTRAEAEDFAVLLLSAMPLLGVQAPGESALPSRGFVVVTRPAELPGGGAPSAGSAR